MRHDSWKLFQFILYLKYTISYFSQQDIKPTKQIRQFYTSCVNKKIFFVHKYNNEGSCYVNSLTPVILAVKMLLCSLCLCWIKWKWSITIASDNFTYRTTFKWRKSQQVIFNNLQNKNKIFSLLRIAFYKYTYPSNIKGKHIHTVSI